MPNKEEVNTMFLINEGLPGRGGGGRGVHVRLFPKIF